MSERVGVIRDETGLVTNVILWGDHTPDQLRADGITNFEEVTDLEPRPGIDWTWTKKDGYRTPAPGPNWVWNGVTWEPPVPMPTDGGLYQWNESTQTWDTVTPTPTE